MLSFDSNPVVFLGIGYGLLWVVSALAVSSVWLRPNTVWRSRTFFLLLALGAVAFMRLPSVVFNQELNPDESQMVAQVITLQYDPVFWRSVDGTTGGPLNNYVLLIPGWFGLSYDYISTRLTGLVLILATLWLLFRTLESWFGENVARWSLLPPLVLLAMTQNADLVHYSSEYLPNFLLGLLYYGYARFLRETIPSGSRLYWFGMVAGMVPFSKLQAVPMLFCAGLFVAIDILTRANLTGGVKAKKLLLLLLGGLSFPVLVILLTLSTGVFEDMITFYFIGNLNYGGDGQWSSHLLRLPAFLQRVEEFSWFMWLSGLLGITFLLFFVQNRFRLHTNRKIWAFLLSLLGFTFMAITRTGTEYIHHLLFLVVPVGLLNGWFLSEISQASRANKRLAPTLAIVTLAAALVPYGVRYVSRALHRTPLNSYVQNSRQVPQSAVTQRILQYAKPGEKLVVWGWQCKYYVEAQMPQGVNENHSIRSIFNHPLRDAYQKRYIRDIRRSMPPVFVDAVGNSLWLSDRATEGHETIAPLRDLIATKYRFAGEIDNTRIYVRTDRYQQP
ncbi:hypothetical protein ACFQ4C_14625 [Larkinella insperata]|uniref:Glycosyltransferase RgtA/B/C/D-like domain-containing protein n=1 Tax=Larkinella insperata TaxID=332158 RepID=A0ABW3QA55_9BACT|nr:hypothetical protein [Larkinella insperata]